MMPVLATCLALLQEPTPPETVAVLPFYSQGGTDTAIKSIKTGLGEILKKAKCQEVDAKKVEDTWFGEMQNKVKKLKLTPKEYYYDLPMAKHMLDLGQRLKCDYVIAYRAKFSDDTAWQGLGPKTKAMITMDMTMINVKSETVIIDAKGIRHNGTVSQTAWRTAADVFLSSSALAVLGGGAVTPLYEKGGLATLGMCVEPWLAKRVEPPKSADGGSG